MSTTACSNCGVLLPPQTHFCPSCGTAVHSTLSVSQPGSPSLPFPAAPPAPVRRVGRPGCLLPFLGFVLFSLPVILLRKLHRPGCLLPFLGFVLFSLLGILLVMGIPAVNIHDDAHILDTGRIQAAEQDQANVVVDIYTVSDFPSNDPNALLHDANTRQQNETIVIEIDPQHRQVAVDDPSSDSQSNAAYQAFVKQFASTHNYTAATVAAIDTLGASSSPSSPTPSWLLPLSHLAVSFNLLIGPAPAKILGVIALIGFLLSIFSLFPHKQEQRSSSSSGGGRRGRNDDSSDWGGSDSGGGDSGSAGHF